MDGGRPLSVPVKIELGPGTSHLMSVHAADVVKRAVEQEIAQQLNALGLTGEPDVTIAGDPEAEIDGARSSRAIRIQVHGRLQPYTPLAMQRAWCAAAPPEWKMWPVQQPPSAVSGFPDGWLRLHLRELEEADPAVMRDFLVNLTGATIRERPSCLLTAEDVNALLEGARAAPWERRLFAETPAPVRSEPPRGEYVRGVCRRLLDLGVSLSAGLVTAIQDFGEPGVPARDAVEAFYARVRPNRLEIHLHPGTFDVLGMPAPRHPQPVYDESTGVAADCLATEKALYASVGVRLPDPWWVPSIGMPRGMVSIKCNDLLGQAVPLPPEGYAMVEASPAELQQHGVPADPTLDPVRGRAASLVDQEAAAPLGAAGIAALTARDQLQRLLSREITRNAGKLLTVEDVEYELVELDTAGFSELVRVARALLPIEDLTQVLRALLDEGIPITDLASITWWMLAYDTVPADPDARLLLGDRPPAPDGGAAVEVGGLLRHVRRCIAADRVTAAVRSSRLPVVTVEPAEPAHRASSAGGADRRASGDVEERWRDVVWEMLHSLPGDLQSITIVAPDAQRMTVRGLLAGELPTLSVAAQSEVSPDLPVDVLATVPLPGELVSGSPSLVPTTAG